MAAFYRLEPWDGSREERQQAVIAASTISALTKTPQHPQSFAPYLKLRNEEGQTEEQMQQILEGV